MRVTILGSGTSHGVPSIGCQCPVCTSPDPRDTRTRCSIVVEWQGKTILVDTPPELRQQAIRSHVTRVDALLYTHSHADHLFGLDDVRRYCEVQEDELPVYGDKWSLQDIQRAYRYVFTQTQLGGGKPRLDLRLIDGDRIEWEGLTIEAIPVWHGELGVQAFRFGDFAYVTDVSRVPDEAWPRLAGLHTLILGAIRWEPPHPTHMTVGEALEVVDRLRPRRTFLTHITHLIGHVETERRLPAPVRLAYDGLVLDVPD